MQAPSAHPAFDLDPVGPVRPVPDAPPGAIAGPVPDDRGVPEEA